MQTEVRTVRKTEPAVFHVAKKFVNSMIKSFPSEKCDIASLNNTTVPTAKSVDTWKRMKRLIIHFPQIVHNLSESQQQNFRKVVWLWGSGGIELAGNTHGVEIMLPTVGDIAQLEALFNKFSGVEFANLSHSFSSRVENEIPPPLPPRDSDDDERYTGMTSQIHTNPINAIDAENLPVKVSSVVDKYKQELTSVRVYQLNTDDPMDATLEQGREESSIENIPFANVVAVPINSHDHDLIINNDDGNGINHNPLVMDSVPTSANSANVVKYRHLSFRSSYFSGLLVRVKSAGDQILHGNLIDKDVLRSNCDTADQQEKLGLVLRCYSLRNTKVGYCQGMNFFTIFALKNKFSMEESFWFLAGIVEKMSPNKFTEDMTGVHVDCKVIDGLLARFLPRLHKHMLKLEAQQLLFMSGMLITLFSNTLPHQCVENLWDYMFLIGPRLMTFTIILSIYDSCKELLLSASSLEALNESILLQIKKWKAVDNASAVCIMDKSLQWLVQIEQEQGLLEDALSHVTREQNAIKQIVMEKEVKSFSTCMQHLRHSMALLSNRALTAVTAPQRVALLENCSNLQTFLMTKRADLYKLWKQRECLRISADISTDSIKPRIGISNEELVLKKVHKTFQKLLDAARADVCGLFMYSSTKNSIMLSPITLIMDMINVTNALANTELLYSNLRLQLGQIFWSTALGNLNRVDKKGYLDLDFNHELEAAQFLCQRNELVSENSIKNKTKQKKQKQSTLSVFASKEELDQLTKAKVITLRKVLDGSITVLLLAKMFSMELNSVGRKYLDADTRLDTRSNINSLITVVSAQIMEMLKGKSEAFIETYHKGLIPWRKGVRRLLILAGEEQVGPLDGSKKSNNVEGKQRNALSLIVLARCLNLSELLNSQVQLFPRNLRNPYAQKLVDLFAAGIQIEHKRIALAKAVDACLKALENVKPWVVAIKQNKQVFTRQQLLPVFSRTLWIQQQVFKLSNLKWRSMLAQQAKQYETDLRAALIAATV